MIHITNDKIERCWWCGSEDNLTGEHKIKKSDNELPRAKAFRLGSNSLREEGYLNYSKVKTLFAASGRGINP